MYKYPFFFSKSPINNTRLAGTWKSVQEDFVFLLLGSSCLVFGGHVELDWKFTILGSSEYRRFPTEAIGSSCLVFGGHVELD